jgi:transglutaminase-like putative cysteine protease
LRIYFVLIILLNVLLLSAKAQTQAYGIIDTADLKMTSCDFEKDANAEVLFDKAIVETGFTSTTMTRHRRIKILTDKGLDNANVDITYYTKHGIEDVSDLIAETINLNKNSVEYKPVDRSLIYKQNIDKTTKKVTFTFPGVKAGSVIEYSYKLKIGYPGGFPDWDFQEELPVRYSELKASIRDDFSYKLIKRVYDRFSTESKERWMIRDTDSIGNVYNWAMKNISSYKDEPYSTCKEDNIQRMQFLLTGIKVSLNSNLRPIEDSWFKIRRELINEGDFGGQLNEKIDIKDLLARIHKLTVDDEKIHAIFKYVQDNLKWDGKNDWYPIEGVKKTWENQTGNCTEINLVLANFIKQAGFKCYLDIASTRDNGKPVEEEHEIDQFNKTVVIVQSDGKKYVLDASEKYGLYTDMPFDILNSYGLVVNSDSINAFTSFINEAPARKITAVNGQITPDGKLWARAQVNNFDYHRTNSLNLYRKLGETKYTDQLRDNDNNLKIVSFKRENVDIDTLPLTEDIDFRLDLTGSDDTYIYFNPNLFTSFRSNPFLSENRNTTIDFGCNNYYAINGRYKIPAGYKIDALPKTLSLSMPDKSINFKRIVAEQDGDILVHYVISYKQSIFLKEEYPAIHEFYKKMYEMLNEQIVLKKSG